MLRCSASRGPALDLRWPSARHPRHPGGIALDWTLCDLTHTFHTHGAQSLGREQLDTAKGSHAAAGGEPARRAPEMPASRAPDPAAPTDAASRTLAPVKGSQETYTLAHEENVRFVSEAWQQVEQQLGGGPAGESGPRPVQYVERTPNPRLQNFVPIDLDEWWAQQFLARITNCS